jgi:hypothetical protein
MRAAVEAAEEQVCRSHQQMDVITFALVALEWQLANGIRRYTQKNGLLVNCLICKLVQNQVLLLLSMKPVLQAVEAVLVQKDHRDLQDLQEHLDKQVRRVYKGQKGQRDRLVQQAIQAQQGRKVHKERKVFRDKMLLPD